MEPKKTIRKYNPLDCNFTRTMDQIEWERKPGHDKAKADRDREYRAKLNAGHTCLRWSEQITDERVGQLFSVTVYCLAYSVRPVVDPKKSSRKYNNQANWR